MQLVFHHHASTPRCCGAPPLAPRLASAINYGHCFSAARHCRSPLPAQLLVPCRAAPSSPAEQGAASPASAPQAKQTVLTLPTILTLLRVAAIPALVQVWYSNAAWGPLACTGLFVGASITDFLDGYLARKMNVTSAFGAFLDPVADKLMVATVLVLLSTRPIPAGFAQGNAWLVPCLTCAIIGREITMSALREWAAALGPEAHQAVAVSWLGKWKTAAQMISITLLLAAGAAGAGEWVPAAGSAGVVLLGVAAGLTVWSLCEYFAGLWRFMV